MQLGVLTWKIDAEHGDLPATASAFAGYVELLTTGTTTLLPSYAPASRGGRPTSTPVRSPPPVTRGGLLPSRPPSFDSRRLRPRRRRATRAPATSPDALEIRRARRADLAGRPGLADRPLQRDAADRQRRRPSTRLIASGSEPRGSPPNTPDPVRSTHANLRQRAAGSRQPDGHGPAGRRRGVRPRPRRQAEHGRPRVFRQAGRAGLRTAAGRPRRRRAGGIRPLRHADRQRRHGHQHRQRFGNWRSPQKGLRRAKQKMAAGRWPRLRRLTLVELYLDRAADAWRALQMQQSALPDRLRLVGRVGFGPGADAAPRRTPAIAARTTTSSAPSPPSPRTQPAQSIASTRPGHCNARAHHRRGAAQHRKAPAVARDGQARVQRRQRRSVDRPHAVQPADPRRDGAVPRGHHEPGRCSNSNAPPPTSVGTAGHGSVARRSGPGVYGPSATS